MNKGFIQQLTEIVEANLANEKFGIEELASEIGMSHSNLHRKLKSSTNQTISQFIREIRLKKAKELLLSEDLTAAEISYRVGFGSPTYFNKCFHEYFGFAPGELRNHEQENDSIEQSIQQPIEPLPGKNKRRRIVIGLISSLIVIIPLAFFLINWVSGSKAANTNDKSIAVLPFKYLSDEPGKQYLADGMMDDILTHLSKIKDLRVLSRTSVEQYRKTDKTAKVIGKELGVAYLLEGSLQKEGDKIRLIMQLIKTGEEGHAWANEYDRPWKDIFSVQSEVAETIASELQAVVTPMEKQLIRKIPTTDLTAYDFYQRGQDECDKFGIDNDTAFLVRAQKLFHKALSYDSTYAQAYFGLARVRMDKANLGECYLTNFMDSVLILANRAISFDNQLAEAYCLRGQYYFINSNIEQAIKEYDKGIELNPNDWFAYFIKGTLLHYIFEDYTKAIDYYLKASVRNRGNQLPFILGRLGYTYLNAGFPDKAKKYTQEIFSLTGDSASYYGGLCYIEWLEGNFENALLFSKKVYAICKTCFGGLALSYSFLGREQEANFYWEKQVELLKKSGDLPLNCSHRIGYSYQKVGKFKEAEYYYNQQIKYDLEIINLKRNELYAKTVYYEQAAVYAVMGDKGKAYENLDELNKKQSFGWERITWIKHDPLFNSIRQEPRFQKIAVEMEAKYQAEHERVRKWLEENKML